MARFVLVGHPQHIIVRGNNRAAIFNKVDDYLFYLEKLKLACEKHECDLHAYVLMTNHVHLLMTPHKPDSIAKAMQMIGRYYVQYFNYTYKRTGTLWEGRYKATLINSEQYALTCYRYIELNPVRANMVAHPADYPWSSYRANANGEYNALLIAHTLYQSLGKNKLLRCDAYRALFDGQLTSKTMDEIRSATNKSWVLGDHDFNERIKGEINRQTEPKARGGDRKSERFKIN